MKKLIFLALATGLCLNAVSQKKNKRDKGEFTLKTYSDSVAYAFGVSMAHNIKNQGVDSINSEAFRLGFDQTFRKENNMSNEQAQQFLKNFIAKRQLIENENNKKAGEQFLILNKAKEGVISLPSGLQYKILNKGSGTVKPGISDKVKTHYHGTLIDGTVFDSSVDRGEAISFPVNGVIRGWVEILQMMVVGDKYEVYIPYDLAYGARSTGKIKPFSTLIFTIELLDIEK